MAVNRTVAIHFNGPAAIQSTATALALAERLFARGHRVMVFASGDAATLAAGSDDVTAAITALVHRGVHAPTLQWVVDAAAAQRLGVADTLAPGVVAGDFSDLWSFVRDADVILSPPGAR